MVRPDASAWVRSTLLAKARELSAYQLVRGQGICGRAALLRGCALKHNVDRVIFPRCSGILLHITSLPGDHGIGDLGNSAHDFVEFLAESGQKIWQVLPLNPTGYGDSPYQCFSAFAGNPLFIDLKALLEQGLLSAEDLSAACGLPEASVEYQRVIEFKYPLLRKAALAFFAESSP